MLARGLRHGCDQVGEKHADREAKQDPERPRLPLMREPADANASNDTLERGPDDDPDDLRPDFRRKPGRQTVERPEHGAEKQTKNRLVHCASQNCASHNCTAFYTTIFENPLMPDEEK